MRPALQTFPWLMVMLVAGTACADEKAEKARAVVARYQDAVLVVKLVIKGGMSFGGVGGQDRESKKEATGVVIDPSGLVVSPLSETDPYGRLEGMLSGLHEGGDMNIQVKSELSDVKLVLPDAREIPAKVVLRDKDLDLAFIRPIEKLAQPMPSVDLAKAADLALLDEGLILDRMPSSYDRAIYALFGRVQAIVEKPRRYYSVEGTTLGAPVFDLDGQILGINLLTPNKSSSETDSLGSMRRMVLPASDILEAAAQAPQADAVPVEPSPDAGEGTEPGK
jgi:hypothetical protein